MLVNQVHPKDTGRMKTYWQLFGNNHLNIPIDFCRNILSEKMVNPASLYLYLLFSTNGNFSIEKLDKSAVLSSLGVKKWETITNRFEWLFANNWIYHSNKVVYLKRLVRITYEMGVTTYKSAMFERPNFKNTRAFAIAACISYRIQRNIGARKALGPVKWGSENEPFHPYPLSENGGSIGNEFLGANLGLSKTTGHNYKQIAQAAGFIKINKVIAKTQYKANQLEFLKKNEPELAKRLLKSNGRLFLQCPDEVVSFIRIKKHRGLRDLLNTNKLPKK